MTSDTWFKTIIKLNYHLKTMFQFTVTILSIILFTKINPSFGELTCLTCGSVDQPCNDTSKFKQEFCLTTCVKRTEKEDGQTKIFRYCSNDKQTTHCVDHLAKRRYVSAHSALK